MFDKRRAARRELIREKWQIHLTERKVDLADVEAIRNALVDFIITNRVSRSDAEWLVHP